MSKKATTIHLTTEPKGPHVLPVAVEIEKEGDAVRIFDAHTGELVEADGGKLKVAMDFSKGKTPIAKITFEAEITEVRILNRQLSLLPNEQA